jgi:hypothetical protein
MKTRNPDKPLFDRLASMSNPPSSIGAWPVAKSNKKPSRRAKRERERMRAITAIAQDLQ